MHLACPRQTWLGRSGGHGGRTHHGSCQFRIDLSLVLADRSKSVATHVLGTPLAGAHRDHSDEASSPGPFTLGNSPARLEAHWHDRSSGESIFRAAFVVLLNHVVVSLPPIHAVTPDSDQTARLSSTCPTSPSASSAPPCAGRCRLSLHDTPAFHVAPQTH